MSNFASTVMLGDLNDFIAPSQACINPLFVDPKKQEKDSDKNAVEKQDAGLPKIGLQIESDFGAVELSVPTPVVAVQEIKKMAPDLIKTSSDKTAKVSLTDCLACSGCVTSAETVLIEQQSGVEFLSQLKSSNYDLVVVTLSTQTLSSLGVHFKCSPVQVKNKVRSFLNGLGVHYTLDTSCVGDIALLETGAEFLHRYRNRGDCKWTSPETSVAESRVETRYQDDKGNITRTEVNSGPCEPGTNLPMLSSACPGWICFAEKTAPEALPYVSTSMSPQEISGVLVKRFISKIRGVKPNKIYHCAVMPCPDKKLEASRKDFYDAESMCNDVDCVLTSNELLDLLIENGITDLENIPSQIEDVKMEVDNEPIDLDDLGNASIEGGKLISSVVSDGGSGGYLDFVFRLAAKELFGVTIPDGPLPFKQGRNVDIKTVTLQVEGKQVLKFASAYGFRNIQSIIRQMKRGKSPYDFVEIMACPGGCLNGGGQIRSNEGGNVTETNDMIQTLQNKLSEKEANRTRLEEAKVLFHDKRLRLATENPFVQRIYRELIGGDPYSDQARSLLHTRYHAVPKLQNSLLEKW